MAKGQRRTPGRDVRGGNGKRGGAWQQAGPRPHETGGDGHRPRGKGRGAGGRGAYPTGDRTAPAMRGAGSAGGGHGRRRTPHDAGRHRQGERAYVEGRRACAEALDAHMPVRRALVARGTGSDVAGDVALERLVARLAKAGVEIEAVPRERLDALSSHGAHQGVVLEVAPFSYASLDDIVAAAEGQERALVVVLDHVTDEGNLGAIIRSAEVVGAVGVVIAKARAASVGIGAYKTSAGAVMHLPVARVANIASAVDVFKDAGFWAMAATEHAERVVWDAPIDGRLALVMGSEDNGVSRLVRQRCDLSCRLPQVGRVESLNVAQATTALCYEWLRRGFAVADAGAAGGTPVSGQGDGAGPLPSSWDGE